MQPSRGSSNSGGALLIGGRSSRGRAKSFRSLSGLRPRRWSQVERSSTSLFMLFSQGSAMNHVDPAEVILAAGGYSSVRAPDTSGACPNHERQSSDGASQSEDHPCSEHCCPQRSIAPS